MVTVKIVYTVNLTDEFGVDSKTYDVVVDCVSPEVGETVVDVHMYEGGEHVGSCRVPGDTTASHWLNEVIIHLTTLGRVAKANTAVGTGEFDVPTHANSN
jgi:hypothetical protein